jgi:hypothetical protein
MPQHCGRHTRLSSLGFSGLSRARIAPQLKPGSRSLSLPNHAMRNCNPQKAASSQQNRKNKYVGANPEEHNQ